MINASQISPRLKAAAASTRSEADVRASRPLSMLDVIRKANMSQDKACPWCGELPPLAVQIAGRFVVGCENQDCLINPQATAGTLAGAWAAWNSRAKATGGV